MSEVKNKEAKKNAIVEKVSNAFVKVYSFAKAHPVLTMIVSNVAIAGVSYGIGMAVSKHGAGAVDISDGGVKKLPDGIDSSDFSGIKHNMVAGEGYFFGNELHKIDNCEKSEAIDSLTRGIEAMGIGLGDGVFVVRNAQDEYSSILMEEPDITKICYDDIRESYFDKVVELNK